MYIEINEVSKTIKNQTVLDNISVQLEKGNCYGFVGANGCGKTMLFRALCGFMRLDNGEITVDGKKIGKDDDFISNAGIIIGEPRFLDNLSGYENLLALAQIRKAISEQHIVHTLEVVGLLNAKDKKVRKYSLGMKQRLRIAQAMMEDPEILVLDEPFNGLDKTGTHEIQQLLLQYKQAEKTILLTSHDERNIELLCDKVFEMDNGRITA
ncbi:ABC-2 type transport system ATP-binding protein [Evansella caseinilytica]|uniref:ABC-2 type transport system ATP-binding protein n=1 Tax=Evansella caseinilytica TaxID=1503961 RepID=A0A1H3TDW7_9BACI|nr:ABC-2 type transport system ATP-binding protein [Evansella caseinilytica]